MKLKLISRVSFYNVLKLFAIIILSNNYLSNCVKLKNQTNTNTLEKSKNKNMSLNQNKLELYSKYRLRSKLNTLYNNINMIII